MLVSAIRVLGGFEIHPRIEGDRKLPASVP